ncbi:MAG: DEAD/DEAH box helicase [Bacillota bacterium]
MAFAPVRASRQITEKYLRYLRTIFQIGDSEYARQFEQALSRPGAFSAGPYLDVSDSFETGQSIDQLIASGELSPLFERLDLPPTRPLYQHQEQAIRRALRGENIVVSTGTGSGKTESFLIPVFNHLLRQAEQGILDPGVRALFVYPMNALANDQVGRLRSILADFPEITYGCYTGQTKHRQSEALADYRALNEHREPAPNELISRERMLATPPHILITNYAMLEHLMVRPTESVFFSAEHAAKWKLIILDEAHIYRGSTGIEVSMLLRRLRAKLENDNLQYILTSATLGGDRDDAEVASFATDLCASPFRSENVIRARRVEPRPPAALVKLPKEFYLQAARWLDQDLPDETVSLQVREAAVVGRGGHTASEILYQAVVRDPTYWKVRSYLQEPRTVEDLARHLGWTVDEVADFVAVATRAEYGGQRLFDARYHMLLRATESVFITLNPSHKLFLNRKKVHREDDGTEYKVFEIAVCSACHTIHLVGKEIDGYLEQYDRTDELEHKQLFLLADEVADTDEDHALELEQIKAEEYLVCVRCGWLRKASRVGGDYCEHGPEHYVRIYRVRINNETGTLYKCISCENFNGHGILRQFYTGQEAVTSVIGTALFEELPSSHLQVEAAEAEDDDTGFGIVNSETVVRREVTAAKQFIAFSDSRQAAAYYASYFDLSYRNMLYKRLVYEALQSLDGAVSINQFVEELIYQFEKHDVAVENEGITRQEAWKAILDEVVNNNVSTSLCSLGLLGLTVDGSRIPPNTKYSLSAEEVATLCSVLSLGMMTDAAVHYPARLNREAKEYFTHNGVEYSYTFSDSDARRYQRSFVPSRRHMSNKRLDYLQRVLARKGKSVDRDRAVELLNAIWHRIFMPLHLLVEHRGTYRLDTARVQVTVGEQWYICSKCRRVTIHNVAGVCPTYKCDGALRPIDCAQAFADNHYYNLYRQLDIRPLRVVEHTAQLDRETAYEYQRRFQNKEIDVLSCSTTFEMGVDVGTLETVFMRNMPPSPANYAQRAGRAGRSKQSAAYALTFCNKSSHDFTFFRRPEAMIRGKINPPRFVIENERIAIRHLYAAALAFFWRQYPDYFSTVADLLEPDEQGVLGLDTFREYITSHPRDLQQYLRRFLPTRLADRFDVDGFGWIEGLLGEEGALTKAVAQYEYEVGVLKEERERLYQMGRSGIDRLSNRIRAYQHESILAFLARKNVLPKYGFPVDTVEMQAHDYREGHKLGVQLQRDLSMAISEYAPGSQVVANGKLLTSRYIRRIPRLGWKTHNFVQCENCATLNVDMEQSDDRGLSSCRQCGASLESRQGTFLIPEYGFEVDVKAITDPGLKKPERTYRGEISYVGYLDRIELQTHNIGAGQVDIGFSHPDRMAVLNNARFYVCEACGYAELSQPGMSVRRSEHERPSGHLCVNQTLRRYSLGYLFETDVIILHFTAPELVKREAALSVLHGLLRGVAAYLDVEEGEIAGCIIYQPSKLTHQPGYCLVLFDKTPGGAGHVRRLCAPAMLEGALRAALALMDQCDCGGEQADSSCYGCLRDYYNQRYHDVLKRGDVVRFLRQLLDG